MMNIESNAPMKSITINVAPVVTPIVEETTKKCINPMKMTAIENCFILVISPSICRLCDTLLQRVGGRMHSQFPCRLFDNIL